ncbi:ATP-binding cassette domain-containing protein, partial [Virgibacillus salexigens]|uniref:ATP-binding cassette domain-containing protein n=1 Tax=Virgibacillus salexigens TaxID=61016 RepID=UPI00190AC03E
MGTLTKPKFDEELTISNDPRNNKVTPKTTVYDTKDLNLWYGDTHALKDINLSIYEKEVPAIIGPSGCGKSTYLKTLNRMVELVPSVRTSGMITYKGKSILD